MRGDEISSQEVTLLTLFCGVLQAIYIFVSSTVSVYSICVCYTADKGACILYLYAFK